MVILYPTNLNFSTCFMNNVLLEQKMINSRNKCHFVENKTDIMRLVLKMQYISFLPQYIKCIYRGILHAFMYANMGP
jgi:hypothetical protein